jgi:ribosomal protein L20
MTDADVYAFTAWQRSLLREHWKMSGEDFRELEARRVLSAVEESGGVVSRFLSQLKKNRASSAGPTPHTKD